MYALALDLDRTLLNTDVFAQHLARTSASMLGEPYNLFISEMENYKAGQDGGLQYYDYFAHMKAAGITVDDRLYDKLVRALVAANTSYVYDEVEVFLRVLQKETLQVFVLTYGEPRYQKLKYDVSPELHGLPLHSTLQDKSMWLATHFASSQHGLLVDDKDVYEKLPQNWHMYHLQRELGNRLDVAVILRRIQENM